jgi:hypothetical protein
MRHAFAIQSTIPFLRNSMNSRKSSFLNAALLMTGMASLLPLSTHALDVDLPRYSITFGAGWAEGDAAMLGDSLTNTAETENSMLLLKGSGLGGIAYVTGAVSDAAPDPTELDNAIGLFGGATMTQVSSGELKLGDNDVVWVEYEYTDLDLGDGGSGIELPTSGSYRVYATQSQGFFVTIVTTTFLAIGTKPYPDVEAALATLQIKAGASIRPGLQSNRFSPVQRFRVSLDGRRLNRTQGTGPSLAVFQSP